MQIKARTTRKTLVTIPRLKDIKEVKDIRGHPLPTNYDDYPLLGRSSLTLSTQSTSYIRPQSPLRPLSLRRERHPECSRTALPGFEARWRIFSFMTRDFVPRSSSLVTRHYFSYLDYQLSIINYQLSTIHYPLISDVYRDYQGCRHCRGERAARRRPEVACQLYLGVRIRRPVGRRERERERRLPDGRCLRRGVV